MKNIQVIDRGLNCTFSIFQATDEEFALLFPEAGQDIQYAEDLDFIAIGDALDRIWERPTRTGLGEWPLHALSHSVKRSVGPDPGCSAAWIRVVSGP
jgi:hypothetical protein